MPRVPCVVFDIGETIISEERPFSQWAKWLGVAPSVMFASLGAVIEARKDHREAFELVRAGINLKDERDKKEAAGLVWQISAEDLYADTIPCLERLAGLGVHVGLAGNQPSAVEPMLANLGLPVAFIASSQRWGVNKPSPGFFARVVEAAGYPPEEIAYVGDRLDNDVLPAKAIGMYAILIRRGPWGHIQARWPEATAADAIVESLLEVPELVTANGDR